ncbi:MAG: WecB/TagA/CpsF family glycosyltransferase [Clostridia bacterium]|nr:WecB/TagA/CpsF family glycosyltransferase [Clostridia bacterium]
MAAEYKNIDVRGTAIANITMQEAVLLADEYITSDNKYPMTVVTPNAEIVQSCIENGEIAKVVGDASIRLPDGSGVLLAAKILGTPLKEKVAGIEFGENLLKLCAQKGYKVFFLGAKPGVADAAAEKLKAAHEGLCICGTNDGYFKKEGEENEKIIQKIIDSKADVLFVCLGAPAQEKWMAQNKEKLCGLKLMAGLGGSLDVFAGTAKRAPKFFLKFHLEWLYRLLCQPSRIGRMMKLPKFIFGTILYNIRKKR